MPGSLYLAKNNKFEKQKINSMKALFPLSIFILSVLLSPFCHAQGCSDAGFCTINSLKPHSSNDPESALSNQIKLGISLGKADHDITVISEFLEYHKQVSSRSSIDIKLSYISQKNDLVSSSGFSDLFINANWSLTDRLKAITGCKLALSDGNNDHEENYLPMDFQSSLGTFDLILGLAYEINKLQIFVAAQIPLNDSKNKFLAESYPSGSDFRNYQSTNNYQRKSDILLRLAYPFTLGEKFSLTPSILPIYHLGDDQFTNASGMTETITDSKGLTLNANVFLDYSINAKNTLSLSFGAPLSVRKVRPDGLTRKFVAGLDYAFRF